MKSPAPQRRRHTLLSEVVIAASEVPTDLPIVDFHVHTHDINHESIENDGR